MSTLALGLEISSAVTGVSSQLTGDALEAHVAAVEAAADIGFDSVWVSGPVVPQGIEVDPLTLAAGLADASAVPTLGVIADVTGSRHPAILARDILCLDVVSHGRSAVMLVDRDSSGGPHAPRDDRQRLAEASAICRAMFASSPVPSGAEFKAGYFKPALRPVQVGGPPVFVDLGVLRPATQGSGSLAECLRNAAAVVLRGTMAEVQEGARLVVEACRTAAIDSPPPVLWGRSFPVAELAHGPAPLTGTRAQGLDATGISGALVGIAADRPPTPDEVAFLVRWGRQMSEAQAGR